ncbi:MAG TPA: hypothetical protein VFU89_06175 [Rhabdochlamydiaceae bacterium]|nr:hypothetical protein [Rhabdochlamydiaceae bacterium]
MKRSFAILLMTFSVLLADRKVDLSNYRLFVTQVDPDSHYFALSNNLVFGIPETRWATQPLPKVGDEVYIGSSPQWVEGPKMGGFDMRFVKDSEKKLFSVAIVEEYKTSDLSYVASKRVEVEPAGWISPSIYRDAILLSDGSIWIKIKRGRALFKPNARVFVSKQKEGDYLIIDLDQLDYSWERKLQKVMAWRRFERVMPWSPSSDYTQGISKFGF